MNVISRRDVLLSWAVAEAISPRWVHKYAGQLSARAEAALATPDVAEPVRLPLAVQNEVISLLRRRRKALIEQYITPAARWVCISVLPEQLGQMAVAPALSHRTHVVTLQEYLQGVYSPDTWHDPRNAARRWLESPQPVAYQGHPILAYDDAVGAYVLVDGYTRCFCHLLRGLQGEALPPLEMVVCEHARHAYAV